MVVKVNENNKAITKVGIYLRKSRAEDGIRDLEKHKTYLVDICEKNGWKYELYEEIESSIKIERKELQRMREDIELGKIDAVMVNAVDRLSRDLLDFMIIMKRYFLDNNMTKLYVKDLEHDLTDNRTVMLLQIQATLSQAEYSFIVIRLREGRKASAKNGSWSGKQVYGYKYNKEKKKAEIVPDEAKTVRDIADLLLIGDSYGAVCEKINLEGKRTRKGNLFNVHNIKSIIHSPFIRGHVIVHWSDNEVTEKYDAHEAIISEGEYNKINEILENRANNYKSLKKAPKHFLQGLLKCPKCSRVMSVSASKDYKTVNKKRIYIEGTEKYYIRSCRKVIKGAEKHICGNNGIQAEKAEEVLREMIKGYHLEIDNKINELAKLNMEEIKTDTKNNVDKYQSVIANIEGKMDNLDEFLTDKTIEKDRYTKKMNKLKDDKAKLIKKLNEAKDKMAQVNVKEDIKHLTNLKNSIHQWDDLSTEKKRSLIQMLFSEIEFSNFEKGKKFILNFKKD